MRVWPSTVPTGSSLSGSEGTLVSISISVDPRRLESLLETLAQVGFPINPQIYHDAVEVYVYRDQREETESTTLVEFPAYAERVDEVRQALESNGFDPGSISVTSMLDEIHSAPAHESAPAGSAYVSRYRVKQRAVSSVH
jgi:hypothetical protein